ncbi:HD domain-containing protein [Candidatus Falkowbacteria bacterium]|nr:HD domain-containing protein [Candidatus Falkowbacteria bacterium]
MIRVNFTEKYRRIWDAALPFLEKGRPGDDTHAAAVAKMIMDYDGSLGFDKDVLVPAAILHDIGHAAIMPEHFKFITGSEKLENGKLVHMLAGAKIAHDILSKIGYETDKTVEIVEIVSMHDADQLKGLDISSVYNTDNKKVFHDIDSLDRYNDARLFASKNLFKDQGQMIGLLEKMLDNFYYDEFRQIAKNFIEKKVNIQ